MRIRDPKGPHQSQKIRNIPSFGSFLGSDGGSCGHRCTLWPPWMRLDEVADWVWERI